jgi:hypothetical protein
MTDELEARAFTVGSHIYLGRGEYAPESSHGLQLLAHEATHTIQQGAAQTTQVQAKKKDRPVRKVTKITLFVDRDIVVLELDGKSTITLPTVYNGKPPSGTYKISGDTATPPIGGVANAKGWIVEWTYPLDATFTKANKHTFHVIAGRPGPSDVAGTDESESGGKDKTSGAGGGGKDKTGSGAGGGGKDDSAGVPGSSGKGAAGGDPLASTSDAVPRLTPEEEAVWRQIAELMKGASGQATEDPAELVRLFQVLRSVVVDPKFGAEGESWIRFARFLDQNRDKIEGYFKTSPKGKITIEILEKIIAEYDKFLATTPDQERPGELETVEDYDKEFQYDPGWQKLSRADRELLIEYSRMAPGEISDKKIDFTRITSDHKVIMALKLSDTSLLGEMAEAAKNAFTDPKFLVTLFVVMAIYVGLWLTPDPSWVTKLLAGTLTVVLLTQFAIEDIYGFAVAWSDLIDDCIKAMTVAALKAAGNKFLKRIGPIGFDIMLFIVMWRVGKLAGPKLSKIGAERGVARAEGKVKTIETKPGSGVAQPAGAKTGDLLSKAKSTSEGTTATQVLNALDKLLPQSAREGLAKFRGKAGDANVLKSLEGQSSKGSDLARYLTEQGMTPEAVQAVKAQLNQARLDLARAKLVQAETIKDPALRQTVREEQYRAIRTILEQAGALETAEIKQALAARDVQGLVRGLRNVISKLGELRNVISKLGEKVSAHETQGALGESIQRAQLRIKYAGRKGVKFLSNLALVRKIGQYKSLREWITAEEARIRERQPGISQEALNKEVGKTRVKLFEKNSQVYESVGEVDTMVVEPGAKGLLRPLEVAEAKAGGAKQPSEAAQQLTEAVTVFEQIAKGQSNVQIFEMTGKKQLGKELTSTFDLSQSGAIERTTFGPEGKGFDVSLGFTEAQLRGLAESLLKNLPPDKPATIPPVTSPREEEKNTVPAR